MGCSKSTAILLARQVGWPCIDLDKHASRMRPEWKSRKFSHVWASANSGASNMNNCSEPSVNRWNNRNRPYYLGIGGGTSLNPGIWPDCVKTARSWCRLQCAIEELLIRCAQITNRPLFRDEASFRRLYQERLPWYELSDYRVDGSAEPLRTVEEILVLGIFPKVRV